MNPKREENVNWHGPAWKKPDGIWGHLRYFGPLRKARILRVQRRMACNRLSILVLFLLTIPKVAHSGPLREADPNNPNFFLCLGIDPNDPDLDDPEKADALVKTAYRRAALKYHPDNNPDKEKDGPEFRLINDAYVNLSDRGKRAFYRAFTSAGFGTTQERPTSGAPKGRKAKDIEDEVYRRLKHELEDHFRGRIAHILFGETPDEMPPYSRLFAEAFTTFLEVVHSRLGSDSYSVVHHTMSLPRETEYYDPGHRGLYRFLNDMLPIFGLSGPTDEETNRVARALEIGRGSFASSPQPFLLLPELWYQAYSMAPDEAQKRRMLPDFLRSHLTIDLNKGKTLQHLREELNKLRAFSANADERELPIVEALMEVITPATNSGLRSSNFHFEELRVLTNNIAEVLKNTPEGRHALLLLYERQFDELNRIAEPLPKEHSGGEYERLRQSTRQEDRRRFSADFAREHYILHPLLTLLHESPDDLLHEALKRPTLKAQLSSHYTAFAYGKGEFHGRCSPLFERITKILGAKRQLPAPPPPVED
jgi:curved DNA-binding protein CbpA